MNDTVSFQKGFQTRDAAYWRDVGFTPVWEGKGRLANNGKLARMTVFPNGYHGNDYLRVEASLPKIVFGHNATLPSESQAREAASWLCGYVSSETGLIFTLDDVKTVRIDYTRDYYIQEDRARSISLNLRARDVPEFPQMNVTEDSVCFQRKQGGKTLSQIEIYPKFLWATGTNQPSDVIDASRGKLRLEVRLMHKGLKGIKGATKPLDYLTQSVSDSILNEAANMLDLQRIIDAQDVDFHERLIVHGCGQQSLGKQGPSTFVELVRRYGKQFYLNPDFHYPRSTYFKHRKAAEKLGFWHDLVAASEVQTS
jgi:hypothetical protein